MCACACVRGGPVAGEPESNSISTLFSLHEEVCCGNNEVTCNATTSSEMDINMVSLQYDESSPTHALKTTCIASPTFTRCVSTGDTACTLRKLATRTMTSNTVEYKFDHQPVRATRALAVSR